MGLWDVARNPQWPMETALHGIVGLWNIWSRRTPAVGTRPVALFFSVVVTGFLSNILDGVATCR
jgi:hypothetical protein